MKVYDTLTSGRFAVAPRIKESLPEARDVTWDDDFFEDGDGDSGTIAVFDFDYALATNFRTSVRYLSTTISIPLAALYVWMTTGFSPDAAPLVLGLALVLYVLVVSLARMQIGWEVRAQHLAITRDGIRFVTDRRKSCWGLPMCDKGKNSKTVPFDKITDCDIHEPAGATCCCILNVLTTVNVDTASSGSEGKAHELRIVGLKDPHSFKRLVWAMKRAKEAGGTFAYRAPSGGVVAQAVSVLSRGDGADAARELEAGCPGTDPKEIPGLLQEIRDELRHNNELLRQQRERGHIEIV